MKHSREYHKVFKVPGGGASKDVGMLIGRRVVLDGSPGGRGFCASKETPRDVAGREAAAALEEPTLDTLLSLFFLEFFFFFFWWLAEVDLVSSSESVKKSSESVSSTSL